MGSSWLGLLLSPMSTARPLDRAIRHQDSDRVPRRAGAQRYVARDLAFGDRPVLGLEFERRTVLGNGECGGLALRRLRGAPVSAREIRCTALSMPLCGQGECGKHRGYEDRH